MNRACKLRQQSAYEDLAQEYYDRRHMTSRNFEAATASWTSKYGCPLPADGLVLDIGSGRGSAAIFCHLQSQRIVAGDIAVGMLTLPFRQPALGRVACSALSMPFVTGGFSAVTGFLFDPFNKSAFVSESFRVLTRAGVFFGTLPHYEWGTELRRLRGGNLDIARFVTKDGRNVDKPSYLATPADIEATFTSVGYGAIELHSLTLPRGEATVSPDILEPATARGISPYDLPIVQLVVARKT